MVIVKLTGGLGNQLFQYAAARRLSILHQTTLKLDIAPFEHYRKRKYSLAAFHIQEAFATREETTALKGASGRLMSKIVFRLSQRLKPYYRRSVFREPVARPFDPNILKTPKDVYLDGYWQSERYFEDIRDVIRREFTIRYKQDQKSEEIAEKIANTQSVSIHVRRGEYVSNPEINRIHGTCSLEYYEECVRLIAKEIMTPCFFVFSDDPQWTVENLRLDYPTDFAPTLSFTHNDPTRSYENLLWLMSMCKHNITANSSFSWWGAWLNANPNKIVLAPRRWYDDTSFDTRDLFPAGWIKV